MVSLRQIKKDYQEICEKVAACKTVDDLQQLSKALNTTIEINGENINNYAYGKLADGKHRNEIKVDSFGSLDDIYFQSDNKGTFRCTYFDVSDKYNDISFLSDITIETLDAMYQKAIVPWGAEKCDCFTHRGFCFAVIDTGAKATVEIFASNKPSEALYPLNSPIIDSLTTKSCADGLSLDALTRFVKAYINDNYDRLLADTMNLIPDYRGITPISDELINTLNARKSPDDLLRLSRSDSVEDRIFAAKNRYSGWDILNALAADADDRVKYAVIERNQDQSLFLLSEDPNVDIRIAVASKGIIDTRIAPEASGRIRYNDPDPKYRAFMAKTYPSVYYEDPSPEVRRVVAEQGSHLETLMYDKNLFVRGEARSFIEENKETMLPSQYKDLTMSSYECLRLANSSFSQDRLTAANSPSARDDVLEILKDDDDEFVRCAVAARGYALTQYIHDPFYLVRIEVAKCGYGLDVLVNDIEPDVRKVVASQGVHIEQLLLDPDQSVQEAARAYIEQSTNAADKPIEDKKQKEKGKRNKVPERD